MAIVYQAQDADEWWHDSDAEQLANAHLYGVISGCQVTYDAANMTLDIAAGQILHNGLLVTVAAQANAATLVADGSNPRWTLVWVDSAGTGGITSGTAAVTPSKPELGDYVLLAAVKVEAGQTVANNIAVKLDKRLMTHSPAGTLYKYKTAAQNFASTTLTDVSATSGNLAFTAAASTAYEAVWTFVVTAMGAGGIKGQISGPAAPTAVHITVLAAYADTGPTNYRIHSGMSDIGANLPITAFATNFMAAAGAGGGVPGLTVGVYTVKALIVNGANAGAVTLQLAQNTASGTTTINGGSMVVSPASVAI